MDAKEKQLRSHHFVLVHGACHGAWCWYKLKPQLESAGHRVTILDLAGSGMNAKTIYDVWSFAEYNKPLLEVMAMLKPEEKVVLVGHSFGGLSLALIADKFPEKVSVAVFLTAFLPDTAHPPSYVLDKYFAMAPKEAWLDTQFAPYGDVSGKPEKILTSMFFGPEFLSSKLYQLSSREVPPVLPIHHFVPRPFIRQRWMIENTGVEHVVEIPGADHMPMLSKEQELSECLIQIAATYAQ